jgi:hypothetical protein
MASSHVVDDIVPYQIWSYVKFLVLRVFCHLDKNKFKIIMKGASSVKRSYHVIYKGFHSFQRKSKSFQYTSVVLQRICQNVVELSCSESALRNWTNF